MEQVGADTTPIRTLEARLRSGVPPREALRGCGLPAAAEAFARTTFALVAAPVHATAAAFVLGREHVLPRLFRPLLEELRARGVPCDLLQRYLERHISIDGDEHGPASRRLLQRLVGSAPTTAAEAQAAARAALDARRALWDAARAACEAAEPEAAPVGGG